MAHRSATFTAIGTHWQIDVVIDDVRTDWAYILASIKTRINDFDKAYSRFREDSLVTRMSKQAGRYELPSDGYKMVSFYKRLYDATDGKVTPLIGQTIADAGYGATYSLKPKALHQPPKWHEVLSFDQTFITVTQPVLLDFGAAGKGYLVDIVGELLESAGIHTYIINAGGDIRQRSKHNEAVVVGLENPSDAKEAIGVANLANSSICASAGTKRAWGAYNHIIDPVELQSPDHVSATWVIADDTMMADGLATALFFTEPTRLSQDFSFSHATLDASMQLHYSVNFPVTVFEAV